MIQGDENKFKLPAQYIALDTLHLFWCGTKRGIFNVNIRKLFKEQQDLDTESACLNAMSSAMYLPDISWWNADSRKWWK